MEFEVPPWLTKEYIQKALDHGKEYKVIVENMKVDMPVAKGNNYFADILGVQAEYRQTNDINRLRKKSFILKVPIKAKFNEKISKIEVNDKELLVYNELWPKLRKVLGEDDTEDGDKKDGNLLVKSYYSAEEGIIILEDLKVKGYKMADRLKGLDYEHCIVTLKALAKFHAGSVALHNKEPEFIERIGNDRFYLLENKDLFSTVFVSSFKSISKILKDYPNMEKYSDWFAEAHGHAWKKIVDEVSYKENQFNVLNHGDFWIANMMFKYNSEGKPIKNIPLDFQCCRFTTPAIDLFQLFSTSVQEELRTERFDELISFYVNELNINLEHLQQSQRLNETEFKKSLYSFPYFRISYNVAALAIAMVDSKNTKLLDLSQVAVEDINSSDTDPFVSYLKNEHFLKELAKRLKEFEKAGIINISKKNIQTR